MASRTMLVLLAVAGAVAVVPPVPTQNFMATDRVEVNATAAGSVAPALQPSDVFDADFPVDMAEKTPMELRYQAQADYAKAIASLKKEAAEAEAARKEMEKQLAELQAAERAAADAAAAAERAAQEANKLKS